MNNVTQIRPNPAQTYYYRKGDIVRALAEALRHEQIAEDVEAALSELLFLPADEAERESIVDSARILLSDLLDTWKHTRKPAGNVKP